MNTTKLILTALTFTCGAFAQENKENPKAAMQGLMERAHDAKQAGRLDEAKELAARAERIQAEMREREEMKKAEKPMEKKIEWSSVFFKLKDYYVFLCDFNKGYY